MDDERDRRLSARAELQHGVFGRELLRELEFTKRQVARRTQDRRWLELYQGVWRMAGAPQTWRGDVLAGVLAGGPTAVASHRSAAALRDLPGGDERLQEITCARWLRAQHGTLVAHETKRLSHIDRTVVDAIPVTTVVRTLLDLGSVRHPDTVELAVEAALRKDLTTIDSLEATVRRLGRRGRNGAGVLRAILADRTVDRAITASTMEIKLLQVLRKNGLPEPVVQYEVWHKDVFLGRVDAAYIQWKIAMEYESYEHHTGKRALERDSARRNAMLAADWKPVSVTWKDLRSGGIQVCRDIRAIAAISA